MIWDFDSRTRKKKCKNRQKRHLFWVALKTVYVKISPQIGATFLGKLSKILKQKLLSENIDLSYTHYIDNFKTSISSIIIDKNGERLVLNNREFSDLVIKNNIESIFRNFINIFKWNV